MEYAQPREDWTPGGSDSELEDWMTQQYLTKPNWKLPAGYEIKDGKVVHTQQSFINRHPWLYPVLGIAGGAGLAAAGVGGGAGAAASATGAGGVGIGETGAVTGLGGSGFGAAGAAGAAGAGGTVMGIGERVARAAVPAGLAVAGRVAGGGQGQIPPELRQILELQRQRLQMQSPLYESILRLAQSRLPISARSGPSGASDPTAALARLSGNRSQG